MKYVLYPARQLHILSRAPLYACKMTDMYDVSGEIRKLIQQVTKAGKLPSSLRGLKYLTLSMSFSYDEWLMRIFMIVYI